MLGTLFVVATPIGNLEDLSARAIRVLSAVALIAAEDTRHTRRLLERYGITTPTTSLHAHNETGKAAQLVARLQAGDDVALVSDAGTPTVSDPGQPVVAAAWAAGLRVEPVPGPSAAVAALSVSGIPGNGFVFLGFPPHRGRERTEWFARVRAAASVAAALVFYEAPHRIMQTLAELQQHCGTPQVLVARELTKAHETILSGPLDVVAAQVEPRGEFTVVVRLDTLTTDDAEMPPAAEAVATAFAALTADGHTRRQALSALSRQFRLSAREVFRLLETAKEAR